MPETNRHPTIETFLAAVDDRLRRLPEHGARPSATSSRSTWTCSWPPTARAEWTKTRRRARPSSASAAPSASAPISRRRGTKTAEYARFFAWYATFIVGAYLALFWSMGDPCRAICRG